MFNCKHGTEEGQFYRYYFGRVCLETGLKLADFYKPTFSKDSKVKTRSFKRDYINTLMQSRHFVADAVEVFEREFEQSQREIISNKFENIFRKLQEFFEKEHASQVPLEVKFAHFLNEMNLQFPWTFFHALSSKRTILERLAGQEGQDWDTVS